MELDNWHCILAVLEDYIVIIAAVSLSLLYSWWCYPITLVIVGARQRALATLTHEAAHKTLARSRWLNNLAGSALSGHLVFQLLHPYSRSHVSQHHGMFGNVSDDPDLAEHVRLGLYDDTPRRASKLRAYLFGLFLGAHAIKYIAHLFKARFQISDTRVERHELFRFAALWTVLLSSLVLTGTFQHFIFFWVVPYLTSFLIIGQAIELTEHYPSVLRHDLDIFRSRNRHPGKIEKFFTGIHAENFHLEHHLKPRIPFWNLEKANSLRRKDPYFTEIDDRNGGVFFSSANADSILTSILGTAGS